MTGMEQKKKLGKIGKLIFNIFNYYISFLITSGNIFIQKLYLSSFRLSI